MPKVFIVEKPKDNIDVSEFGEMTCIFEPGENRVNPFNCMSYGMEIIKRIEIKGGMKPEDSFLTIGPQIWVMTAYAAIITRWPSILILLLNPADNKYVQRRIESFYWGAG